MLESKVSFGFYAYISREMINDLQVFSADKNILIISQINKEDKSS